MKLSFNTESMADYSRFLRLKVTPSYSWHGESAIVPDEYAAWIDGETRDIPAADYTPSPFLFDYQRDIAKLAISKRKFAVFADCGLGKTLIMLELARHAARFGKVLIVSPLMVVRQTLQEADRFYPGLSIGQVTAGNLAYWLKSTDPLDSTIGVTNYEAIRDELPDADLAGLLLDESSMLKSHYGAWGTRLIEMGRGVPYKLALTGTPAPNDRIEYANHAVFLDHFRTTNEFLARYFVNKGQTQERWILKPHALSPFYRDLSHWCIFLSDPSVYGWKDNCDTIPPIHVHIEEVPLTAEQRTATQKITGGLMVKEAGGIGQRGKLAQIAKGSLSGEAIPSNKPEFIRQLVASWPDESTIVWCHYNAEQDAMERIFGEAAVSISGSTPERDRQRMVDDFKSGRTKVLISKPKLLGFGLNLQIATRQVFSGLQDSYEEFYQAVKRSNRIGSTLPLNVHIPVTEIEEPMVSNVLRKADRVQADTEEQERLFKAMAWTF